MHRIVIFGTGKSAEKVCKSIKNTTVEIVNFVDNNYNKHGKMFNDREIISPNDLVDLQYDYIVIAIIKYTSVIRQLLNIGVSADKIIPYFDIDIIDKEITSEIIDVHKLLKDYYDLKLQRLTIEMNNKPYEILTDDKRYIPEVKDINDTIDELINSNMSISRFGDGEIKLIAGKDIGFQKANSDLSRRLKEVLYNEINNHIVGILNVFGSLSTYTEDLQTYFRSYLYEYDREFQYGLLNQNKVYYDAFITRPYISYRDKSHARKVFDKFKKIWDDKEILIVEGDRSRLGRGNDLFDNVKDCKRIICPNENAFEQYDKIFESIVKQDKKYLILLALGPTATILAYDLAKAGYRAIDIGHIDIEYEWYQMGAEEKVPIKHKYTNEAYGGNSLFEVEDEEYDKQIIEVING